MSKDWQNKPKKQRTKLFGEVVKDADPDFGKPVEVYRFGGAVRFREKKPYEPSRR